MALMLFSLMGASQPLKTLQTKKKNCLKCMGSFEMTNKKPLYKPKDTKKYKWVEHTMECESCGDWK